MRRAAEIAAFLGMSAAVHAGIAAWSAPETGTQGQGAGGVDRVTLSAAPESLSDLVAQWETAPEPVSDLTALAQPAPTVPELVVPEPDATLGGQVAPAQTQAPTVDSVAPATEVIQPQTARPVLTTSITAPPSFEAPLPTVSPAIAPAPDLPPREAPPELSAPAATAQTPSLDTPESALATRASPRPDQRPETRPPPSPVAPASTPQPTSTAAGGGGGATRGDAATPPPAPQPQLSVGQRQSLLAQWGAQIQSRIERNRPRVQGRGRVVVAVRVALDGRLMGVSVAQSSGNAVLDEAALAAVRRAGRFPAAPAGLTGSSQGFSLPIRFR